MVGFSKRVDSVFNRKKVELESPYFINNGGALMEKLISLSNGRDEIQVKRFTIEEISKLTNNFAELFKDCGHYKLFRGNLQGRKILVQIWETKSSIDHNAVIFATAIPALMSHLKYTLKLIGCCTDLELPDLVYEYSGNATLTDLLGEDQAVALSWGHRIKIARDVAAMVVYLHTSFPVVIIHRDLKPSNVLIDQNGDAKLFDFSLSIEIPEGESELEDLVTGTVGFLDPEYYNWGCVTAKSDVYSFGIILLMLLTGKSKPIFSTVEESTHILHYVEQFFNVDEKLIDCNISKEVGMDEFQALKDLAISCTEDSAELRPEMIDVARRLHEIEMQVKDSCRIVHPLEDNQNALRKKLMVLSNGKYKEIPFQIFSSEEIINVTDNFQECLAGDSYYGIFRGYLDSCCPVLVTKWEVLEVSSLGSLRHEAVIEAAICSLLSDLKLVSKFLGCCLEFEIPCLVFEDVGGTTTLYEILYTTNDSELLSWGQRLKIASDVAAIVSHLQTAFPTPIIHRDLKPSNVIISKNGEAKLAEFSLAMPLPPGKSQVKENYIFGTWGSLDPDYIRSKFVSIKTDVYSFGVLLFALLTGMNAFWLNSEGHLISLTEFVEQAIREGQSDSLVDPRILEEVEMTEFEAVLDIGRRCTRIRGEDRPEMIDVARLLLQIDKDAATVNS